MELMKIFWYNNVSLSNKNESMSSIRIIAYIDRMPIKGIWTQLELKYQISKED